MLRSVLGTRWRMAVSAVALLLVIVALIVRGWQPAAPMGPLPSLTVSDPTFKVTIAAHRSATVNSGNTVELLLNGDQIFPAKIAVIRGAKTSISYAEYFYAEGEPAAAIAAALAERCRAGLAVKVLLDGVGALSMQTAHRHTMAVSSARRSIEITNPYFLPDERLGDAILHAARRGVRVRILVPGVIDHALVREAGRRHFGTLLEAGVEIWEYKPALLHSRR